MQDYELMALIEAAIIIETAHGEVITGPIAWGESLMPHPRAEEILNHAREYLEDQTPESMRGEWHED